MIDEKMLYDLLSTIGKKLKESEIADAEKDCGFNIFNVLGVSSKEVIICRFLGELLNPDGSHSMGHVPLLKFVNEVLNIEDFDESAAKYSEVLLEEATDESRRVDIAIHSGNRVFPLEVKIWAGDQYAQLSSYFNYYKRTKKLQLERIYYLTPTGWEPSEKSKGKLQIGKEIACLSFKENIKKWIISLISKCENESEKIIMMQFVEVIDKMCAENKIFDVIKNELGLSLDNYKCTPELEAVVEIINQGDKIKKQIRILHLIKYIKFNENKYEFSTDIEEDAPDKQHAYVKIVSKADSRTVAWLCIDTNLYLVAKKVFHPNIWVGDGSYWQYISPEGKKKSYDMKNLNNFINDNRPLKIDYLLDDIDMTENDSDKKGKR